MPLLITVLLIICTILLLLMKNEFNTHTKKLHAKVDMLLNQWETSAKDDVILQPLPSGSWLPSIVRLLQYTGLIIFYLIGISLCVDKYHVYEQAFGVVKVTNVRPIFNQAFITGVISIATLFMLRKLLLKDKNEHYLIDIPVSSIRYVVKIVIIITVYTVGWQELSFHSMVHWPLIEGLITGIYTYLFISRILYKCRKENVLTRYISLLLAVILLLAFIFIFNPEIIKVRTAHRLNSAALKYFLFNYVLIAVVLTMLYQTYQIVKSLGKKINLSVFQWVCSLFLLYLLSASMDHMIALNNDQYKTDITLKAIADNHRYGYTVLWILFAAGLIYLGIKWRLKQLRIISICLFTVILAKFFLFDLLHLSTEDKAGTYISSGVLLLVVPFIYQWFKKTDTDK
jgi:hypothetical protein